VDEAPLTEQLRFSTQIALIKSRSLAERVIDELGLYQSDPSAASALVLVQSRGSRESTRTDANGRYSLVIRGPGGLPATVRAGGGRFGLSTEDLVLGGDPVQQWDAPLARGLECVGRLVDLAGAGLAKWRIEIEPEDGSPWIDGTVTDEGGHFAVPNVENTIYRMRVFPPESPLACFERHGLRPGVAVELILPTQGAMALGVLGPAGIHEFLPGTEFHGWFEGSREGLRVLRDVAIVPAGNYSVEILFPGIGWESSAPVLVLAGAKVEVPRPVGPAFATLDRSGMTTDLTLYWLHAAVPSRVELGVSVNDALILPPGHYRAFMPTGESREFRIDPGHNSLRELLAGKSGG
jgi:hypothetical protein